MVEIVFHNRIKTIDFEFFILVETIKVTLNRLTQQQTGNSVVRLLSHTLLVLAVLALTIKNCSQQHNQIIAPGAPGGHVAVTVRPASALSVERPLSGHRVAVSDAVALTTASISRADSDGPRTPKKIPVEPVQKVF